MTTDDILQRNYDLETGRLEQVIRADERAKVIAEVEEYINQEQEVLINRGSDGKDKWTPTKMKLSTVGVAELRAKLAEMKGKTL